MDELPPFTEKDVMDGFIPRGIEDRILQASDQASLDKVREIIGGWGGGWDDPSLPPMVNKTLEWWPHWRRVRINKLNALRDVVNGKCTPASLAQRFAPPLLEK